MLGSRAIREPFLTCLAPGFDLEIAVRDIEPGEEITDDYGTLNIEQEFECRCGSPRCRRVICPDDALRCAPKWEARVAAAFPLLRSVVQPLWSLVREARAIADVLDDLASAPSPSVHWLNAPKPRQNAAATS